MLNFSFHCADPKWAFITHSAVLHNVTFAVQYMMSMKGKAELVSEAEGASGQMGEVPDLDVLQCNKPGSVCQQLVERLQAAEFGGSVLQAAQPALLSSSLQEACAVLLHQVGAVVSGRRLRSITKSPGQHIKDTNMVSRRNTGHHWAVYKNCWNIKAHSKTQPEVDHYESRYFSSEMTANVMFTHQWEWLDVNGGAQCWVEQASQWLAMILELESSQEGKDLPCLFCISHLSLLLYSFIFRFLQSSLSFFSPPYAVSVSGWFSTWRLV